MAEIKTFVDEKVVMIPYIGPIIPKGGIYGPVPAFKTTVQEIALLLTKGYPVSEVLPDKTFLPLDLTNYNVDHTGDDGKFLESVKAPVTDPIPVDDNGVVGDKTPAEGTPTKEDTTDKTGGKSTVVATPATAEKTDGKSTVFSTSGSKADKLESK